MIILLLTLIFGTTIYIENEPLETRIMPITAYSEIDSCHYENCLMASGKRAYVGAVACPRSWELGTKITINGKSYTCEDRYNANLPDRIDIFQGYGMESYKLAKEFGIKQEVVIIK